MVAYVALFAQLLILIARIAVLEQVEGLLGISASINASTAAPSFALTAAGILLLYVSSR